MTTLPADHLNRPDRTADLELQRRVENYLRRRLPDLDPIDVEIRRGTAILRGTVFSSSLRWRYVQAARHVAGVLNVIDRLLILPLPRHDDGVVVSDMSAEKWDWPRESLR